MTAAFPITDRPVRFALVGCGRISANHFSALGEHAGRAELVAVAHREFRALTPADLRALVRGERPVLADVKSLYDPAALQAAGFTVFRL